MKLDFTTQMYRDARSTKHKTIVVSYVNARLQKHKSLLQYHIRRHVKELNSSEICKSSSFPEILFNNTNKLIFRETKRRIFTAF